MPYLNSAVFYRYLQEGPWEMREMAPRPMAAAVERGELDAGPLPVAEIFRIGAELRPMGGLCVAADGPAKSVLLFSRVPVQRLDGRKVAVTSQTATSVQLLRVLFRDLWQVRPELVDGTDGPSDALLLIGDEALRARGRMTDYGCVYDLGDAWRQLTGLPFVFAAWVVRRDAPREKAALFEPALEAAFKEGIAKTAEIAAGTELFKGERADDEAKEYILHFTYRLGKDESRAVKEFRKRLGGLPGWTDGQSGVDNLFVPPGGRTVS